MAYTPFLIPPPPPPFLSISLKPLVCGRVSALSSSHSGARDHGRAKHSRPFPSRQQTILHCVRKSSCPAQEQSLTPPQTSWCTWPAGACQQGARTAASLHRRSSAPWGKVGSNRGLADLTICRVRLRFSFPHLRWHLQGGFVFAVVLRLLCKRCVSSVLPTHLLNSTHRRRRGLAAATIDPSQQGECERSLDRQRTQHSIRACPQHSGWGLSGC